MLLFCIVAAMTWWNDGFSLKLSDPRTIPVDPMRRTQPKTFTNRDGSAFRVNVPSDADLCGDAELPCSPFFSTQQMRDPSRLSRGFEP